MHRSSKLGSVKPTPSSSSTARPQAAFKFPRRNFYSCLLKPKLIYGQRLDFRDETYTRGKVDAVWRPPCQGISAEGRRGAFPGRSHICRARRKRKDSSDDEDDDLPSADEDDVVSSSRGSNNPDDDDEDEDLGDPEISDPTTRLFQMVKDRDYDSEEEELDDEDEGDLGLNPLTEADDMSRRGRKRRSIFDEANDDEPLPGVDEDEENIVEGEFNDQDINLPEAIDPDEEIDLDAIMGGAFDGPADLEEDEEPSMPSRAAQHRPKITDDYAPLEEGDLHDHLEEDEEGPVLQYPEPPERSYLLGDLLEMCSYEIPDTGIRDIGVSGIQHTASEIREGDLFVCLARASNNGYLSIETAIENGAVAIVCDQALEGTVGVPVVLVPDVEEALTRLAVSFYNYPSRKMLVVGITGSRGKTSTAWLVRGIFEEMQKVTGMVGSIEYSIAVDKMTANGDLWEPDEEDTTLQRECSTAFYLSPYRGKYQPPMSELDSLGVQKVMAGMADRGATSCVYEAGLEGLANQWTKGVEMDVAVYMGLTEEDLMKAEDPEKLLEDQWQVFGALKDPMKQTAVINMDDPNWETVMDFAKAVPSVTFSVDNKEADVFVEKVNFSMWESEVVVNTPAGKLNLSSTLIGRHNLPNILAAVATGLALTVDGDGIPIPAIVQGIEATEIIPGRCEVIDEDQDFGLVIDSANTPESLSRLLDSIRETGCRRIILVFGCEGERNKHLRPFMGEIAHHKADTVILTNNNPRGERPANIIADIVAGYPDHILSLNARLPCPPGFLQDPGRIPIEALEFTWHYSYEYRRYVMEDRWTALRWAIGTAQRKDCVVVAGKGHEDFQEWDLGIGLMRGWFDDRVECRNALSKISQLKRFDRELDRKELPWMEVDERPDNVRVLNPDIDSRL